MTDPIKDVYEKFKGRDSLLSSDPPPHNFDNDMRWEMWQAIKAHIAQDDSNGAILEAIQERAKIVTTQFRDNPAQDYPEHVLFVEDLAAGKWPQRKEHKP